MENYIINSHKS